MTRTCVHGFPVLLADGLVDCPRCNPRVPKRRYEFPDGPRFTPEELALRKARQRNWKPKPPLNEKAPQGSEGV
jgi:hypothetical protein